MEIILEGLAYGLSLGLTVGLIVAIGILLVSGAIKLVLNFFSFNAEKVITVDRQKLEDKLSFSSNPQEVFNSLFRNNDIIIIQEDDVNE